MEQDSVFIDLTAVKDRSLLNKALLQFNKEAEGNDFYEEFLGYRKQTRNYLGHDFLETMWLPTSAGRKTLIEDGLTLDDGTFVKGFPSYPADATIVRITLANLPYLPATLLKQEMEQRLSCFGEVLDLGISKTDGIYHGEGYATINLTLADIPSNACEESHTDGTECPGHRHLEPLDRMIIWDPRAVEQRKILLQWDQMPDFCRNCQSTDHCRADCPDYKKWVRCYHCNETGHVFKNCKRNGTIESDPAKVRAVANLPTTKKSRKGLKEPAVLVKDPSNTSKGDTPSRNQANQSAAKPVGRSKDTGSMEKSDVDGGRYILATIHLTQDLERSPTTSPIATILNIYGRASLPSDRSAFYSELLDIAIIKDTITNTQKTTFIMGDFNYQYKDRRADGTLIRAPASWTDLLDDYYIDIFGDEKQITWHSGRNSGILDYIFCSSNAHHQVTSISQQFMSPEWTDHALLGFSFKYSASTPNLLIF